MKAALLRLARIAIAQLPALVLFLNGATNPLFVLIGAVINAVAKYLRDKYKWEWLPI